MTTISSKRSASGRSSSATSPTRSSPTRSAATSPGSARRRAWSRRRHRPEPWGSGSALGVGIRHFGHYAVQIKELGANRRVKLLREGGRKLQRLDQLLHVDDVLAAAFVRQAAGQLQVDQLRQVQHPDPINLDGLLRRVREDDRLRLAIPRKLAADEEFNSNTGDRVLQMLTARKRRHVAQPFELLVNDPQALRGYQNVHICREALIPMLIQGKSADERVGN